MPLQTKDLFENATHIAETRISHARSEQSALFWDMVRASARVILGKDRTNAEPARLSATAEV